MSDEIQPKRGRGRPPKQLPDSVLKAAALGESAKEIAKRENLPYSTVKAYLNRHAAEIGNLREVRNPELMGAFHDLAFRAFERTLSPDSTMTDLRNASITMGVATDKLQLLAGQPTQIVAGVHAHRVDLSGVAEKLAAVARLLPKGEEVIDGAVEDPGGDG